MSSCLCISVVVPVYNVKRYLRQCVESVLAQSYPVFEVLLVDDGSTDGSSELCEQLSVESERVRVVHKQNAGLGFARNTGLDNLAPETTHVMFVDSDDWLEPGMVGTLAGAIEETGAECAIAGFTKRNDAGAPLFEFRLEDSVWEGERLKCGLIPRVCGSAPGASDSIPMSAWSSIFTKMNIDDLSLRFPSEREVISEDFVFKFEYLKTCKKVVTSSCVGYSYRTNMSSLTTTYRPDRFEACLRFYDYAERLVANSEAEDECVLRLKKTIFIYMKMCISQEVVTVSGKPWRKAVAAIQRMTSDNRLLEIIDEYPREKFGPMQRVFVELLRRHCAVALYLAARCGIF